MQRTVWTIGHSNRSIDAFVDLLQGEAIEAVADVRRFAGSRAHPHFNQQALNDELAAKGIEYRHFVELGGRRSGRKADSPNTAWRVESFNAYADYMDTAQFEAALDALAALAGGKRTAVMCSEALPWRCHRRLIADAMAVRGWSVLDIVGPGQVKPHTLTAFAQVEGRRITYPGGTLLSS